jgi:hypothetical protein
MFDAIYPLPTLVESNIDPSPDDAFPVLLVNLGTSSSRDAPGVATDKTRKGNVTVDDDDNNIVPLYSFLRRISPARESRTVETVSEITWCY